MKPKRYVVVGLDPRSPGGAEEDFQSAHDTLEDAKVALGNTIGWPRSYVLDLQPDDSPDGMPVIVWTAEDEAAS